MNDRHRSVYKNTDDFNLQYVVFFSEVQCPIYLSGWIAAKSVHLFVAHPERYYYLVILGETPPEELSLATRSAKAIGSAIEVC